MAALRRHDIAEVRALLPRVLAEAETIAGPDYLAGAKALLAWLAWLDRHPDDVIKLAEEIATLTTGTPDAGLYYGPVHLWPLAAVHLEAGHLAEAVAATRRLRDHSQLPADLEAALTAASQACDQDQPRSGPDQPDRRPGPGPRPRLLLIAHAAGVEPGQRVAPTPPRCARAPRGAGRTPNPSPAAAPSGPRTG